jgi:putative transposase
MHNFRKSTRLSPSKYLGAQSYFVTICCDRRRPYLAKKSIATRVVAILHECAANQNFQLHAYCAMPDHLHILTEGVREDSSLGEFMRIVKLRTAFEFRQSHNCPLWEMSYYDHILRSHDPIETVACYIWNNPVRAKLCVRPQDFLYSGSQTIPWMQGATGATWTPPWKS